MLQSAKRFSAIVRLREVDPCSANAPHSARRIGVCGEMPTSRQGEQDNKGARLGRRLLHWLSLLH
jgi:hypothetical protein